MDKECSMVRRMDADKTTLHLSTANKRLFIAFMLTLLIVVSGFVAAIKIFTDANTVREAKILDMMVHLHGAEVTDGLYEGTY